MSRWSTSTLHEEFPGQQKFFDKLVTVCYSCDDDSLQNFIMLRESSFINDTTKYATNLNSSQVRDLLEMPDIDLMKQILKNPSANDETLNDFICHMALGILMSYRALHLQHHFPQICDSSKIRASLFNYMENVIDSMVQYTSCTEQMWFPKSLFSAVHLIFGLGTKVDVSCMISGKLREGIFDPVTSSLTTVFRMAIQDHLQPGVSCLRSLLLPISNLILKLYFKSSNIQLCKSIISSLTALGKLENCRSCDIVTFRYYSGRLAIYEGDYKNADTFLSYAFYNCPVDYWVNTRTILSYLIPVKFMMGKVPSGKLLQRYNLVYLEPFSKTLKTGNIREYRNAMKTQNANIISTGLYPLFCKLELVVCRTLCYHIYSRLNICQLKLDVLLSAFSVSLKKQTKMAQVISVVSNLIRDNYLRGYISYQHQVLVLSKSVAFPAIA